MLIGVLVVFSHILMTSTQGNLNDKVKGKTNITAQAPIKIPYNAFNKTKIWPVASEGGAIMTNTPALSLPNENQAIPMTSENASSNNKVKARKGAVLNTSEDNEDLSSDVKQNNSAIKQDQHLEKNSTADIVDNDSKVIQKPNVSSSESNIKRVHKPTIVSADAIAKADERNNDPAVDGEERNIKIDKVNSNGHPGMIMPIVITILVVPMFAVIGYMVLKRGQEAWKNRHYKRMDFLLDGMYND